VSLYASELRRTRREIVRLNRKLALAHVEGHVAERDEEKWKVRLELGTDEDGKKILSPWVKPHSNSSGAYKESPALPAVGDRMRLHSPSGIVGAASYAIPSAFDDELKRPEGQSKDQAVREFDKTKVTQTKEQLSQKTEKTTLTQKKDEITLETEKASVTQKKEEIELKTENARVTQKKDSIELEVPEITKLKIKAGGRNYAINPLALMETAA
jgi:hypothetical protein